MCFEKKKKRGLCNFLNRLKPTRDLVNDRPQCKKGPTTVFKFCLLCLGFPSISSFDLPSRTVRYRTSVPRRIPQGPPPIGYLHSIASPLPPSLFPSLGPLSPLSWAVAAVRSGSPYLNGRMNVTGTEEEEKRKKMKLPSQFFTCPWRCDLIRPRLKVLFFFFSFLFSDG